MMKIFTVTKKNLLMAGGIILCGLIISLGFIKGFSVATMSQKKLTPIYCVQTDKKVVCLSFDAGWGNEDTQKLIDILGKYNIKATFFLVGQWVDKYPDSTKALSDAGHSIQNHSNTHPYMTQLSAENMKNQVEECNKKIEKITGKKPLLLRPPYGDYNNTLVKTLEGMGMYSVQWDVDSLDWKDYDAQTIYNNVVPKVKPGSIILFHNAALHTPEALPKIIEELKKQGYSFMTIADLIYKTDYHIDGTGMQISDITNAATVPASTIKS